MALLAAAVARYPQDHTRELTLYRSYLAEALALAGDRAEARRVAALLLETTGSPAASSAWFGSGASWDEPGELPVRCGGGARYRYRWGGRVGMLGG